MRWALPRKRAPSAPKVGKFTATKHIFVSFKRQRLKNVDQVYCIGNINNYTVSDILELCKVISLALEDYNKEHALGRIQQEYAK